MDYSLPGSSVHGISPGKNTRVGILLTQGLNPHQDCMKWLRLLYLNVLRMDTVSDWGRLPLPAL